MYQNTELASNATLATIYRHRSIRKFTADSLSDAQREAIWQAGQAASSSSFMQCVHIIRVTDADMRHALCEIAAHQQYVVQAPEFWVFCMDYAKHKTAYDAAQLDWSESVLTGAVDAGIMAQNCLLAAESLGLGGVFIGSLRNNIARVAELLRLPAYTAPLFGLCLGHPAQDPLPRPRLPLAMVVSENGYRPVSDAQLADYDEVLADYYHRRSGLDLNWRKAIVQNFSHPVRPEVLPFLQHQGLAKR